MVKRWRTLLLAMVCVALLSVLSIPVFWLYCLRRWERVGFMEWELMRSLAQVVADTDPDGTNSLMLSAEQLTKACDRFSNTHPAYSRVCDVVPLPVSLESTDSQIICFVANTPGGQPRTITALLYGGAPAERMCTATFYLPKYLPRDDARDGAQFFSIACDLWRCARAGDLRGFEAARQSFREDDVFLLDSLITSDPSIPHEDFVLPARQLATMADVLKRRVFAPEEWTEGN